MTNRTERNVRKSRGRPPQAPESVRCHRVVTFVTKPELQRLQELVDASGMSLSATVHEVLLAGLAARTKRR